MWKLYSAEDTDSASRKASLLSAVCITCAFANGKLFPFCLSKMSEHLNMKGIFTPFPISNFGLVNKIMIRKQMRCTVSIGYKNWQTKFCLTVQILAASV